MPLRLTRKRLLQLLPGKLQPPSPAWAGPLALPGTATVKFSQRRASDVVFERAVGDAPFVLDSSAPFGFAYDSSPVSVLLAFQHASREKVSSKTRGRMKATGCVTDEFQGPQGEQIDLVPPLGKRAQG